MCYGDMCSADTDRNADTLLIELEDAREEIASLHRVIRKLNKGKQYFDEDYGWVG